MIFAAKEESYYQELSVWIHLKCLSSKMRVFISGFVRSMVDFGPLEDRVARAKVLWWSTLCHSILQFCTVTKRQKGNMCLLLHCNTVSLYSVHSPLEALVAIKLFIVEDFLASGIRVHTSCESFHRKAKEDWP